MHKQTALANRIEVEIKVWVKKQESTWHAEMERKATLQPIIKNVQCNRFKGTVTKTWQYHPLKEWHSASEETTDLQTSKKLLWLQEVVLGLLMSETKH